MKTTTNFTSDLSHFAKQDINQAAELVLAMYEKGLPKGFKTGEIMVKLDRSRGEVFLINSLGQTAGLLNDYSLYIHQ